MDSSDGLYMLLYPFLVHDWEHGKMPTDLFTQEHIDSTWLKLRDHIDHRSKGEVVHVNRWFQVWQKMRSFLVTWSANLVVNAVQCLQKGWYNSVEDFRLLQEDQPDHLTTGPAPAAKAKAAPAPAANARSVRSPNVGVEPLRLACHSTVHVATEIMENRCSRAVLVGLCSLIQPVEIRHNMDVKLLKSEQGRLKWNTQMACGLSKDYILESLRKFYSHDLMFDMGIAPSNMYVTVTTLPTKSAPTSAALV